MKRLFLVLVFLVLPQLAQAGSQTFNSSGTFTVPSYGTLTVQVWGAGGGGGSSRDASGSGGGGGGYTTKTYSLGQLTVGSLITVVVGSGGAAGTGEGNTLGVTGGTSSFGASLSATGGAGGTGINCPADKCPGGSGGTGSGGTTNTTGATGQASNLGAPEVGGNGGAGANGGAGGTGGRENQSATAGSVQGGGGGGEVEQRPVGGAGARGQVTITWTDATPTCSISASPTTINSGSSSSLTWTSANATTFYISNIGYVTVNTSSGTNVTPSSTITYTGTASGAGGTVTCSRTVTVNQSCTFNGNTVTHGSSVTAYQAATVPYGGSCVSQTRTCTSGTLSGTYTNASCSVTPAANCTVNGNTVLHGASQTFYTSQTAPAGGTCSAISQSRTCTDGTLSGTATYQYGSCTCAPIYSCSANNVQYTNSSCVTSTVATCTAPSFCSAGQSACVNPDPEYTPTGDFSGHLEVRPGIVRQGSVTKVYWNVDNVASCSVMGTNGDSWTGITSGSGGRTSSPITEKTTFTLTCIALSGVTPSPISESVDALISPIFQEQ